MDILVNNISFHSVNNGIQGTIHYNSNLIVPDSIRGYLININNIWSFHFNIKNIIGAIITCKSLPSKKFLYLIKIFPRK